MGDNPRRYTVEYAGEGPDGSSWARVVDTFNDFPLWEGEESAAMRHCSEMNATWTAFVDRQTKVRAND